MIIEPIKTRIFKEHEPLADFILEHVPKLDDGSIIAVTSKIIALSEGRTAPDNGPRSKISLIKAESQASIPTKYIHITLKDGMIMAAAGVDSSNADGKFVLLPRDSYKAARRLRDRLMDMYGLRRLGILVTDSRTFPLRAGVIGMATGFAGFKGIRDYRGKPDIFGRKLRFSRTNVADCLASAAVVEMGEADERQPLAVITGATVSFVDKAASKSSVSIPIGDDIYKPLLAPFMKRMKGAGRRSR